MKSAMNYRVRVRQNESQLTVSHSVIPSWYRTPPELTRDQMLAVVKTVEGLFVMGIPPCREDRSVM